MDRGLFIGSLLSTHHLPRVLPTLVRIALFERAQHSNAWNECVNYCARLASWVNPLATALE